MDLTDKLAAERRGRLAAERLLELKSRELFEANRKLSKHALSLSGQIIEQRDRTERLKEHTEQVEANLQKAEEHVEVVERRLWDSVETISDGFAVFDAQDRLIAANTAWLSMFNYSEMIGPGTLYLELLRIAVEEEHVDLQDKPPGEWVGDMLERWDSPARIDPVEIRLTSGQWFRFVDRRARDGDMVCVAQNVTALKERETELQEARHRAEAANRAKSAFLANMSHELRTPMNGVVAMTEMLLEGDLEDEQRLYVSTIKSSGEALLEIINHVLDFSKMEAERLVLRPGPFDMERLLHEIVTLLGPTARDKRLGLFVDYDLFSPTHLIGDAMRIRQILINLVGNAVKFTEEGHVLIRVLCHDEGDAGWGMTVTVEDTGIGIPEDMREHVFGSFAQVESEKNRTFEGTGLGLSITSELVRLMGGEIWVDSELGEGSCFGFRVTLPAAESSKRLLPRVDLKIGRALVVAPEGHEAAILARQLAQLGLEVAQAPSGSDALALARSSPPFQITVIDSGVMDTTPTELALALDEAGCESARLLVCNSSQDAARLAGRDGGRKEGLPPGIHAILTRPMLRSDLFEAIAELPRLASSRMVADPTPVSNVPETTPTPIVFGSGTPKRNEIDGPAEPGETLTPRNQIATVALGQADVRPSKAVDAGGGASILQSSVGPSDDDGALHETGDLRAMRVLAAEDNKTNRFVLSKLLGKLDIDLYFAVDGVEAVKKYKELAPDLMLMDISMPRMDGKDAARAIRAAEAEASGPGEPARHVPIVAMTAHALEGDKEEILESGIDHYMTKPLRRGSLTDRIVEHCPASCRPPDGITQAAAL